MQNRPYTDDDILVLQESLLLYRKSFEDKSHKIKVELIDVSAISKAQLSVHFRLTGKYLDPNGFNIWFDTPYADTTLAIVSKLKPQVQNYVDKLNDVICNIENLVTPEVRCVLSGDMTSFYCIYCYKDTKYGSHATYASQFDQNTILDVEYMSHLCRSCILECLNS